MSSEHECLNTMNECLWSTVLNSHQAIEYCIASIHAATCHLPALGMKLIVSCSVVRQSGLSLRSPILDVVQAHVIRWIFHVANGNCSSSMTGYTTVIHIYLYTSIEFPWYGERVQRRRRVRNQFEFRGTPSRYCIERRSLLGLLKMIDYFLNRAKDERFDLSVAICGRPVMKIQAGIHTFLTACLACSKAKHPGCIQSPLIATIGLR